MSMSDRASNAAEDLKGQAKEATGRATGDEQMEASGKLDQAKAGLKDKWEDAKDAVAEKFNDATDDEK